jgi:hypothetical protein
MIARLYIAYDRLVKVLERVRCAPTAEFLRELSQIARGDPQVAQQLMHE